MPRGVWQRPSLVDRFWKHVNKDGQIVRPELGPCWLWTAATFKSSGYGQIQFDGRPHLAHRIAWLLEHGSLPRKDLAHRCDVRLCVRVAHLFEATSLENNRDMIAKGRHPTNGKLTDEQAREIRELVASGPRGTAASLARRFGVTEGMISMIVHGNRRNFTPL